MERFDVYVCRKYRESLESEFNAVDEFLLLSLVSVLCSQEDVEYFRIERCY